MIFSQICHITLDFFLTVLKPEYCLIAQIMEQKLLTRAQVFLNWLFDFFQKDVKQELPMLLCTWKKLIQSKKHDCLLLDSFCLTGFLLQKNSELLFYSEQSKHQFLHGRKYQCIMKSGNYKKRFNEKITFWCWKNIPTIHQSRNKKYFSIERPFC